MDFNDEMKLREGERALDVIKLLDGQSVEAIIIGFDLNFMMSVHLKPLPDGLKTPNTVWAECENQRIKLADYQTNISAIAAAAKQRWPEVEVCDCMCTCCCDCLDKVQ